MSRLLVILFPVIIALIVPLRSEELDDPLRPAHQPRILFSDIGIQAGLGANLQSGTFLSACDCEFYDGNGAGYTIGFLYQKEFLNGFYIGSVFGIESKSIESSYIEIEPYDNLPEGFNEELNIPFRNTANADFLNFNITPYLGVYISRIVYFRLGVNAAFPINGTIKHHIEIAQETARLSNGEIFRIDAGEDGKLGEIVEDGSFPEINSFQLGLIPAFGFDIELPGGMSIGPQFAYHIPLDVVSSRGTDFMINSWRLNVEFKYLLVFDSGEVRKIY